VTGRVFGVIALRLDDDAAGLTVNNGAADQLTRNPVNRAFEEPARQ
jgi:hypothetical protein